MKSGRAYFLPVLVGLEGTDLASLVVIVQEGETAVTHEAGTLGGQLTVMNHPSDETTTIKSWVVSTDVWCYPVNTNKFTVGCLFLFSDFQFPRLACLVFMSKRLPVSTRSVLMLD